jgi:esterase/lipase superfamily enzyme
MGMVAESTFYRIQDAYCIEPVQEYWNKTRAEVLDRLRQKDHVVLLGEEQSYTFDQLLHRQVCMICYDCNIGSWNVILMLIMSVRNR